MMSRFYRVAMVVGLVLAATTLDVAGASKVKKFQSYDEYSEAVADGKNVYITAYKASWCGHCKRLAPVWEELASKLQDEPNLVIAEVECPSNKKICDEIGVKGFPTIKSSFAGEAKDTYKGMRDAASLEKFARGQRILWTAETTQ